MRGFGDVVRPYTDVSWLFLLTAVASTDPGGAVALVQPSSVLGARDAGPVRRAIDDAATVVDTWIDDGRTFDAAVEGCAPVLRVGDGAANDWTAPLVAAQGIPDSTLTSSVVLGDVATVLAGFRDEYYGLVDAVAEGGSGPRLLTSGSIDPLRHRPDHPVRFAKRRWRDPRVDPSVATGRAVRWLEEQQGPKLVVATQTRVIEAVVDVDSTWVASVPSIVVRPDDPDDLWMLAAALHAPVISAWMLRRSAGTALVERRLQADLGPPVRPSPAVRSRGVDPGRGPGRAGRFGRRLLGGPGSDRRSCLRRRGSGDAGLVAGAAPTTLTRRSTRAPTGGRRPTPGEAMDWHYGNMLEVVADTIPGEAALIHGDVTYTWAEFDAAADALAADLVDAGLTEQSKVGIYLYNDPAYVIAMQAAFKAGLVPFNVNYRYAGNEVHYLFENADAEAVVFHATFAPVIDEIRDRLPLVKRWYAVDDGAPIPSWAVPLAPILERRVERFAPAWGRKPDHILMMYTGGTTGMPKGVMWTHDDLFASLGRGGQAGFGIPEVTSHAELAERVAPGQVLLPACPLMHGTGQFTAFVGLVGGAAICTLPNRSFDPADLLRTVDEHKVTSLIIVGDAFGRPILAELRANREAYDLSTLFLIVSSGVMWSTEVKQGILEQLPSVILYDSYGSSEAVGLGQSVSTADDTGDTAQFQLGDRVKVFTEDGRSVEPGSDETGFVAIGGPQPLGYYKDEEKTAATFRTIDGVRYSVPGDYAQVNADGSLHLLGRGSVCINTGGEKVFPEEVEEALKAHPSVTDAVCVGLPDERFGETICAVVEPADGPVDADVLIEHVRGQLARYKAPRDVVVVDTIGRAPNGKVDYKRLKEHARSELGR